MFWRRKEGCQVGAPLLDWLAAGASLLFGLIRPIHIHQPRRA